VKLAASQELYAYWTKLRGARSAPERNEVDPSAIRGVLADTFILAVDGPLGFPMRIAGSRTSSLFQRELRGAPFVDLWRGQDRQEVRDILASVSDDCAPILAGISAKPHGMTSLELELLLLPLRHHGATHSRILGCCTPKSNPQWLGYLPVGPLGLVSLRVLNSANAPTSPRQLDDALPAHESAGFSKMAELDRRRHLYVVASNDASR
jgi:hypothetical protein